MKEKWLCLGDDFDILDESGQRVYHVDGRAFSLGNKLSFQDVSGRELAFIRQKLLAWGPTYEITQGDQLVAQVKKKLFTLFRCKFEVDVPGPNDLEARGSFLEHEYAFYRGSEVAAEVSKKWISWTDTYAIDVRSSEDTLLVLSCAVVIDMVCHEGDNRH